jgi:Cysteine sulfinate desulfinase/cysteine desulfurase and related enzymes
MQKCAKTGSGSASKPLFDGMKGKHIRSMTVTVMMTDRKTVYFDNSATTFIAKEVLDEMMPFMTSEYGNPGSIHWMGDAATIAVRKARKQVASTLNSLPSEIYFTSGGTESDNIALMGSVHRGRKIITTAVEHSAVLETCAYLGSHGVKITILKTDGFGRVDPDDLRKEMDDSVSIVSVMAANNVIGTVQDIKEMASIAHEYNAYFHTDAVQAYTKMRTDVKEMGIDMLSISGHKIHGPKGIGVLYVNENVDVRPITFGGGQESGMRPSTENVPGIVGLGKAAEIASSKMTLDVKKMEKLRNEIIDNTLSIKGSHLNGPAPSDGRLCNNAHFRFDGVKGMELVLKLSKEGIAASTASACSAGSTDPSHVMTAIGLTAEQSLSALRISLSRYNTEDDVRYLGEVLPRIVASLR